MPTRTSLVRSASGGPASSQAQRDAYELLRGELKAIVKAKCDALNDVAALRIIVQQQRHVIDSMEESRNFDAFQVKRGATRLGQQPAPGQSADDAGCVRQWLAATLKRRYLPSAPLQQNLEAVGEQMRSLKLELRQCLHSLRLALRAPEKGDTPVKAAAAGLQDGEGQQRLLSELQDSQAQVKLLQQQLQQRNEEVLQLQEKLRHQQQQQQQQHQHQQQQMSSEHAIQIRFLRESLSHTQQQQRALEAAAAKLQRRHSSLCLQKAFLARAEAYSTSFVSTVRSECAALRPVPAPSARLSPTSRLRACVFAVIAARRLLEVLSVTAAAAAPRWQHGILAAARAAAAASACSCAAAAREGARDAWSTAQVIISPSPSHCGYAA